MNLSKFVPDTDQGRPTVTNEVVRGWEVPFGERSAIVNLKVFTVNTRYFFKHRLDLVAKPFAVPICRVWEYNPYEPCQERENKLIQARKALHASVRSSSRSLGKTSNRSHSPLT